MRVLVTGAAGSIGRVRHHRPGRPGHDVVGLDLVPPPDGTPGTWHDGRLRRRATPSRRSSPPVDRSRLDAVVHLAGIPDEASLPDELTSHVVTTAALLDAMVPTT